MLCENSNAWNVSKMMSNTIWKILLVSSLLVVILGLYAFNNLNYLNISGDGVPNRPQKEPPIEYPQDQAVQIVFVVALPLVLVMGCRSGHALPSRQPAAARRRSTSR